MDNQLKYNNIIILDDEKELDISPETLTADSIEMFDYETAIARQAEDQKDRGIPHLQAKREIENRHKSKIEAMKKIVAGLKSYEKSKEESTSLDNLANELSKSGALNDRSIQRVLRSAQKSKAKEILAAENQIAKNIPETQGLPIAAGLIKGRKIDENTGMTVDTFQFFKLGVVYEDGMNPIRRTVGLDAKSLEEFCQSAKKSIDTRNLQAKDSYKEKTEIDSLAHSKQIGPDEAKKMLADRDKEQNLGLKYAEGIGEIETIKKVLGIRELPKEVKEQFSPDQMEKYEKEKVKTSRDLSAYEEKFAEISDKENGLKEAKNILLNLSKMTSSVMDDKQAGKLRKALEKYIGKQEKKLSKEKMKLDKMREGKSLSRYFKNMDSYKELVNAHERYMARDFDSHESLHTERDKGLVDEHESVTINGYSEAQKQQDKEYIIRMFEAEIHSTTSNHKNPIALPEPPNSGQVAQKSDFDKKIEIEPFTQISPEQQGRVSDTKEIDALGDDEPNL